MVHDIKLDFKILKCHRTEGGKVHEYKLIRVVSFVNSLAFVALVVNVVGVVFFFLKRSTKQQSDIVTAQS